jgi:tetratricopeptide (TPR) repeat protein
LLGVLLHAKGDLVGARAQYQTVLKEHGDVPEANLNLGLILFATGEYEEAAKRLQRVLDFDETIAFAHLQLGLLYKDFLGDPAKAREHLERYQALGGDDARVSDWLDELK